MALFLAILMDLLHIFRVWQQIFQQITGPIKRPRYLLAKLSKCKQNTCLKKSRFSSLVHEGLGTTQSTLVHTQGMGSSCCTKQQPSKLNTLHDVKKGDDNTGSKLHPPTSSLYLLPSTGHQPGGYSGAIKNSTFVPQFSSLTIL